MFLFRRNSAVHPELKDIHVHSVLGVNDLPRDGEILLICRSGRRSAQAAILLPLSH